MSKKTRKQPSTDDFMGFSSFDIFNDFDDTETEQEESKFDTLEEEAKAEVTEYQLAIREANAKTRKSLESQWNTDFYFCAFFADQGQRDEFLSKCEALGLVKDNFINGALLAEKLGIDLTPKTIETPRLFAPKKEWLDITM